MNVYQEVKFLRNEFYFWKFHGIMNTLGLLKEKDHIQCGIFSIITPTFVRLIPIT